MFGPQDCFFDTDKLAKGRFRLIVATLPPQSVRQPASAAQCVRMLRSKDAAAGLNHCLQDHCRIPVMPLIEQYVSDYVLNFSPWRWVALAISEFFRLTKMLDCCRVRYSLLRC